MTKNEKYIKTFLSIGGEVEISTSSFEASVKFFASYMVIERIPLTMFVVSFTHWRVAI